MIARGSKFVLGTLLLLMMAATLSASAHAASSAMCTDINANFANVSLPPHAAYSQKSYTSSQFAMGDVITVTVTSVSAPYDGNLFVQSIHPMDHTVSALSPRYSSLPDVGTFSTTVVDVTSVPDITINHSNDHGAANFEFSITCTSLAQPTANPVSQTVAANSSNNSVTLNITGAVATSVAIATAASHGTATRSGTTIRYTPTAGYSGSDSFTYTATNTAGTSTPAAVTMTITAPTLAFSPAAGALPGGKVDTAYSETIAPSAGTAPYTFAVTSGALPGGLTLDEDTGTISGEPTVDGAFNFTITATDTYGATGAASFSLQVEPLSTNANLHDLSLSDGMLSPMFSAITTGYTASVASGASSITVTPTNDDATATTTVNGTPVVSGNASGSIPLNVGDNTITVAVTAEDGSTTKTYTITVTRDASSIADLSNLSLSQGSLSPSFSAGTTTYTASVANSVTSITVSATLVETNATITVNGSPAASGIASSSIPLNIGDNTITVVITAQDGTTTKTFTATVNRALSGNADLSSLSLSQGTLSPDFDIHDTNYTASVGSAVTSLTVTPTVASAGATVTVNGNLVASGSPSGAISLVAGANTITIVVTAQDGVTTKTLSVAVTRAASNNTDLSALTLSQGTLSPAFSPSTTSYSASVAHSVASVTVTPSVASIGATATVNGTPVASGNPSAPIALAGGANSITVTVTAADGVTTKTVTLSVTRDGPAPSANADLSNLSMSQGSLSPAFRSGTTSYTASVANAVTSFTIKPMVDDAGATVMVNGSSVASDSPSGPISLNVGANTIPIVVTASDGTTTKTYSIVITRAGISTISFTPSSGVLKHAMAGEDYTAGITTTANTANLPIFTISSGALPPGMVLNVSTGELRGPLAANTEGVYTFTISVADSANGAGSASYNLVVVPNAVTVADKIQPVPPGSSPPNVYLNRDATGGPFTSAQLASVQPANAGTATIIQGELAQAGPPAGPFGYYMKFTPAPGYTGTVKIGYKLISALGTSNTGTVSYVIAANAAAVASDVDRDVKSFVQARQNLLSSTVKTPGLVERRRMTKAADGLSTRATPNGDGVKLGVSTSLAELRAASSGGKAGAQPFNIWVDGTLLAHRRDDTNGEWGSFGMLSAGADYLLSPSLLVGVSLHLDRMTDPTSAGTELSGNGWLAGPYVSLEIGRGVFFDTSLLYGGSSNDIDTAFFDGSFETARWMWSGQVSGQWNIDDATTLTPRLRALYLNEEADGYDVADGIGGVILLDGFTQEQLRFSVGADVERQVLLENGLVLTPSLGMTAGVASLDNSGLFGSLSTGLRLSDGLSWDVEGALLFSLEGDGEIGTGGKLGGSVRF